MVQLGTNVPVHFQGSMTEESSRSCIDKRLRFTEPLYWMVGNLDGVVTRFPTPQFHDSRADLTSLLIRRSSAVQPLLCQTQATGKPQFSMRGGRGVDPVPWVTTKTSPLPASVSEVSPQTGSHSSFHFIGFLRSSVARSTNYWTKPTATTFAIATMTMMIDMDLGRFWVPVVATGIITVSLNQVHSG